MPLLPQPTATAILPAFITSGVTDIGSRHLQDPIDHPFIQVVDPRCGLFRDASDVRLQVLGVDAVGEVSTIAQHHVQGHIPEAQRLLDAPQILLIHVTLPGVVCQPWQWQLLRGPGWRRYCIWTTAPHPPRPMCVSLRTAVSTVTCRRTATWPPSVTWRWRTSPACVSGVASHSP